MDPPQPIPSPTAVASNTAPGSADGKLRLMCSYGGQIAPRPNRKSLCYNGGDTRIVAVDRRALSVSSLTAHLSRSLLGGRSFCLKYQLPNHDLDSLISVTTDEDLVNMIEEYDRLALSPTPSRLRFFLFPVTKSETNSGEYDARSEAWFFDSLRSARIDAGEKRSSDSGSGVEGQGESEGKCGGVVDSVLGGSESIVLETNSSFGSTGSAASVSSLPVAKGSGGEEVGLVQVQDLKVNLPLLDSICSDVSSITSSNFQSPTLVYLDSLEKPDPKDSKISSKFMEPEMNSADVSPHADVLKPMQVYGYSLSQPMDHHLQQQVPPLQQPLPKPQPTIHQYLQPPHQYIHSSSPYPTQYYPGTLQSSPYTTSYHPYQQATYAINKPYPVYLMPVGQPQQQRMASPPMMASTGPQLQTSPAMLMTSKLVYDGFTPAQPTPDRSAANAYRTGPMVSQPIVVSSEETKFMAIAQISRPPQTQAVAVSSVYEGAMYGCNGGVYDDPLHAQIYKTQPPAPAVTMMLSDNLSQLQLDSAKQQETRLA
ncbi:hypothetical protein V2J09_023329 [Rumex salicifolius]